MDAGFKLDYPEAITEFERILKKFRKFLGRKFN
jgi:hypothetical protein